MILRDLTMHKFCACYHIHYFANISGDFECWTVFKMFQQENLWISCSRGMPWGNVRLYTKSNKWGQRQTQSPFCNFVNRLKFCIQNFGSKLFGIKNDLRFKNVCVWYGYSLWSPEILKVAGPLTHDSFMTISFSSRGRSSHTAPNCLTEILGCLRQLSPS